MGLGGDEKQTKKVQSQLGNFGNPSWYPQHDSPESEWWGGLGGGGGGGHDWKKQVCFKTHFRENKLYL